MGQTINTEYDATQIDNDVARSLTMLTSPRAEQWTANETNASKIARTHRIRHVYEHHILNENASAKVECKVKWSDEKWNLLLRFMVLEPISANHFPISRMSIIIHSTYTTQHIYFMCALCTTATATQSTPLYALFLYNHNCQNMAVFSIGLVFRFEYWPYCNLGMHE